MKSSPLPLGPKYSPHDAVSHLSGRCGVTTSHGPGSSTAEIRGNTTVPEDGLLTNTLVKVLQVLASKLDYSTEHFRNFFA
jgi:hypothetical protein